MHFMKYNKFVHKNANKKKSLIQALEKNEYAEHHNTACMMVCRPILIHAVLMSIFFETLSNGTWKSNSMTLFLNTWIYRYATSPSPINEILEIWRNYKVLLSQFHNNLNIWLIAEVNQCGGHIPDWLAFRLTRWEV